MASLSGQNPSATFPSLIKTINNNPVSASLVQLSDGNGNALPISISTVNVSISSALTASIVAATDNGNGTNFKVGDDVFIGDVNIANTMQVKGQQDGTQGFIKFGSGSNSPIIGGVAGNNIFQITGSANLSQSLTVKGSLNFANGTDKATGTVQLGGGSSTPRDSVTITNSLITTSSIILLTKQTFQGTSAGVAVVSASLGSALISTGTNAGDTSTVGYMIINPA